MKRLSYFLTFLAALCGLAACGTRQSPEATRPESDTLPSLTMQIRQCSRLYTTAYHIRKIVTHDDILRLRGNFMSRDVDIALPLGERKIAIPMEATLKAYIDFSDFSEQNVERQGDRITIVLPDPKIVMTSSKINQREIRSFVGLTRSRFTDQEMSRYEEQGRQAILNNVSQLDILTTAEGNAARVLVPMLVQMGYKEENITIAFRRGLDLRKLINSNIERR